MKKNLKATRWQPVLFLLLIFSFTTRDHAQKTIPQNLIGEVKNLRPTDFSSDTYFEPPNAQQVKMRLSGAQASPLPGGLLDVSQLRVEKFATTGKLEAVASAPQCTFAPLDGWASSPGKVQLQSGDGKFRVEGEGFLLLQNTNWTLTISNRVHTVIDFPGTNPTLP